MFIRETTTKNKKTKTIYKTFKLVENYHTEKGSRQRVIMSLGTLDGLPKKRRRELATLLEARISGQHSFLEEDKGIAVIADEASCISQIKISNIEYFNIYGYHGH